MLTGYDDDLAAQFTRLHNALLHHPSLERLVGSRLDRGGILDVLAAAPTPQAQRDLGADSIDEIMQARSPRLAKSPPAQIPGLSRAQIVVVPGTTDFSRVIAGIAPQLRKIHTEGRLANTAPSSMIVGISRGGPEPEGLASRSGSGKRGGHSRRALRSAASAARFAAYAGSPRSPADRLLNQGRDPIPARQPRPEVGAIHVGFRLPRRPTSRPYYDRKRAQASGTTSP